MLTIQAEKYPISPPCLLFSASDGRRYLGCNANYCSDSAHLGPDATSWRQMPTARLMLGRYPIYMDIDITP